MLAFLGGIGMTELLVVVLIVVLLFGARKIPALARALGQSIAEFRKGRSEGASATLDTDKKSKNDADDPDAGTQT